jgi:hypothetical protein
MVSAQGAQVFPGSSGYILPTYVPGLPNTRHPVRHTEKHLRTRQYGNRGSTYTMSNPSELTF